MRNHTELPGGVGTLLQVAWEGVRQALHDVQVEGWRSVGTQLLSHTL